MFSDDVEADVVMGQSPREGTIQDEGSTIELTVSKGVEQVEVPDLTGKNANDARAELQRLGLKYEAGAAEYSDTVKENRVARQSPDAGEKVDKGTVVTYYLSAGVETITVPDVVGEYEDTARTTLKNAGFKVKVDYASSDYVMQGCVISQSPDSTGKAKKGDTVNIVVSSGPMYWSVSAYVNDAEGGSVSPDYQAVETGGSASFEISVKDGYSIVSVSDSNGKSYGTSSSVTIDNIAGDVSLSVVFQKDGGDDEGDEVDDEEPYDEEVADEEA